MDTEYSAFTSGEGREKGLEYRIRELEILNQIAFSNEATQGINDFLSFSLEMLLVLGGGTEGGIYLLTEQGFSLVSSSDGFSEKLAEKIISDQFGETGADCAIKLGEAEGCGQWMLLPFSELNTLSGFCLLFDGPDSPFFSGLPDRRLLKAALNGIGLTLSHKKMEESLRLSEEKYKEIVKDLSEGFFEMDRHGEITLLNNSLCSILGYSREELNVPGFAKRFLNSEKFQEAYAKVLQTGNTEKGVVCPVKHKKFGELFLEVSLSPVKTSSGFIAGCRGIVRDVTGRKKVEDSLKHLSSHDYLTGLKNRAYFEEKMQHLEASGFFPVSIITCDVDSLKIVNDTLGHEKGDALLRAAARILQELFSGGEVTVARIGGDEFAVLLPGIPPEKAEKMLQQLRRLVEKYNFSSAEIVLSISLGSASLLRAGGSLSKVLQQADENMYRDKINRSAGVRGSVVRMLTAILSEKDFAARERAQKLQELVSMLGTAINLGSREMDDLILLAQVHDIGKIGMPDSVLLKPGRLNSEEWRAVKRHCEIGYRIACSSPELSAIAEAILYHHEWWNGEGYPRGLKGEEIPLCCRILAIAGAFEAMIGKRPYRASRSPREALEELQTFKGIQFDPHLVDVFVKLISAKA